MIGLGPGPLEEFDELGDFGPLNFNHAVITSFGPSKIEFLGDSDRSFDISLVVSMVLAEAILSKLSKENKNYKSSYDRLFSNFVKIQSVKEEDAEGSSAGLHFVLL